MLPNSQANSRSPGFGFNVFSWNSFGIRRGVLLWIMSGRFNPPAHPPAGGVVHEMLLIPRVVTGHPRSSGVRLDRSGAGRRQWDDPLRERGLVVYIMGLIFVKPLGVADEGCKVSLIGLKEVEEIMLLGTGDADLKASVS